MNNNIEEQLRLKRHSLDELVKGMRQRFSKREYSAALGEVLRLERLLAKKRGEPHAVAWRLPGVWANMILNCCIIGDELTCCLIFEAKPKSGIFKILEFRQIAGYKLSDVGDEVIAAV